MLYYFAGKGSNPPYFWQNVATKEIPQMASKLIIPDPEGGLPAEKYW